MVSVLAFVHIVLSIFLVILVLIQDPKGGGGGLFGGGGGSNSLFGATGAPSFLAKITRWVAVIFAASCIAMTIFIKPAAKSVLDGMDIPSAPAAEATTEMDQAPATEPETTKSVEPKTDSTEPKQ